MNVALTRNNFPSRRAIRAACGLAFVMFTGFAASLSAATLTISQAKLGNIFLTTETVEIPVQTDGDSLDWTATDFYGTQISGTTLSVGPDGQATVRPNLGKKGYFALHLTASRAGVVTAQADTCFAVVAPCDVTTMDDSAFGVMTHFAQSWDTDIMPLIARAGLRHIRDEQYWQTVESVRGQYRFDNYAGYMADAAANGLDPLTELTFSNNQYDHDPNTPTTGVNPYTDDGRAGFSNYGSALLGQYGPQINTVEVWNEYNGTWCDGPATADPAQFYEDMLQQAYTQIKAQRPDVCVLGGAAVLVPLPWFEDLFNDGALDYMDGVVIHPYRGVPEGVENDVAALQDLMARYNHGQGPKPVWATECGAADTVNPGRQDMARYLVRLLTLMRSAGVERIYWYLMRDYDSFVTGLVHSDSDPLGRYTPTSAYPAYANLIQMLRGAAIVRREPTDVRTRVYDFSRTDGTELRVAWSTTTPTQLLLTASAPLTVTDVMGESRVVQPTNGLVALPVDDNPVYIQGHVAAVQEVGRDLLLADSTNDFSGSQGTANGTWTYNYYVSSSPLYQPSALQPMAWTRNAWDYRWQCQYDYSQIDVSVAHPSGTGTYPVWAVRRWQSNAAGAVHITGTASRGDGGDGSGFMVIVDGVTLFSQTLSPSGQADALSFDLPVTLKVGSQVDLVVTPGPGTDINFDAVSYEAQITMPAFTLPTTFGSWQQSNFTAAELADASVSGDTAAPMGDGLCNLLRYAFGLGRNADAASAAPTMAMQSIGQVNYLTLSFRRSTTATDLTYIVETAGGLSDGAWAAGGVAVGDPVDNGDGTETVTYRDTVGLGTAPGRFMRLRVVRP